MSTDAVVARIGATRFAIALSHVAEVGNVPPVTRLPGVPAWVTGVANWRGRILPVVDLRPLLGEEVGPLGSTGRVLVLATDLATVAVVVTAVEGTAPMPAEIASFPVNIAGLGASLVTGQVPVDGVPVAVLDVPAVIALRDALPQVRRTA